MSTSEIHIHTHVHLDPDILTVHPTLPVSDSRMREEAGQLSVFDAPLTEAPQKSESTTVKSVSAVDITPQDVHSQRFEIRKSSTRNNLLMDFDEQLSRANTEESAAELVGMRRLKTRRTPAQLRTSAQEARKEAKTAFLAACGHCAVENCGIRANFVKAERVHESATTAKTRNQEPRGKWRKRILKDIVEDPTIETPCLPQKTPRNSKGRSA